MVKIDFYSKNFRIEMFKGQFYGGYHCVRAITLIPVVRADDDQIQDSQPVLDVQE